MTSFELSKAHPRHFAIVASIEFAQPQAFSVSRVSLLSMARTVPRTATRYGDRIDDSQNGQFPAPD